jgi:hypothetical protein
MADKTHIIRCCSCPSVSKEHLMGWSCLSVCMIQLHCWATMESKNSHCWNQFLCNNGTSDHIRVQTSAIVVRCNNGIHARMTKDITMNWGHICARMTCMIWCEECLWNVGELQRVCLSNLVNLFVIKFQSTI